jgi:hypothetical protein
MVLKEVVEKRKLKSYFQMMCEEKKLKQLQSKVELLESLMGATDNYFSTDYLMKMIILSRNEVRKYKINKLFNDEARKI